MKQPPYIVRRAIIAPLVVVLVVVALGSLPLLLLIAAFLSQYVPGRWRILRVTWFLVAYFALEALGLIVLFAIWVVSGFGWKIRSSSFQEAHYQFMSWWLRRVMVGSPDFSDLHRCAAPRKAALPELSIVGPEPPRRSG